jgi:putative sterol carrier protein
MAAADPITEFFAELSEPKYEPMLRRANGTLRFDVEDGRTTRRWLVTMKRGTVSVARGGGKADCVVRADRAVFNDIVTGKINPLAGALRGTLETEVGNNSESLVLFERYTSARAYRLAAAAAGAPAADVHAPNAAAKRSARSKGAKK